MTHFLCRFFFLLILSAFLLACGGGGGDSSGTSNNTDNRTADNGDMQDNGDTDNNGTDNMGDNDMNNGSNGDGSTNGGDTDNNGDTTPPDTPAPLDPSIPLNAPQLRALTFDNTAPQADSSIQLTVHLNCPTTPCGGNISLYHSMDRQVNTSDTFKEDLTLEPFNQQRGASSYMLDFMDTADNGYYGVCMDEDCVSGLAPIILNNKQEDGDGIAAATDIDDDNDGLIEIGTAAELNNIRYVLDGSGYRTSASGEIDSMGCPAEGCIGYEITAPIDLTDVGDATNGWSPIGGEASPFTGILEGNGNIISNLFINRTSTDSIGLFSNIETAIIRNLHLTNVIIDGHRNVGGIVGSSENSIIASSYVTGNLVRSESDVGGLVGESSKDLILSSYMKGRVETGDQDAGGLIGAIGESEEGEVRIVASYMIGEVLGQTWQIGGLIGESRENIFISSSYMRGGLHGRYYIAGLVGGVDQEGAKTSIHNSYAVNNITLLPSSSGRVREGLIPQDRIGTGGVNPTDITIESSYWDSEVSGIDNSTHGTPYTTMQLQSPQTAIGIYELWRDVCPQNDSLQIWAFREDDEYPAIQCTPDGIVGQ